MKRQWKSSLIWGGIIVVIAILIGSLYLMVLPHSSAKKQAIKVAQTQVGIEQVNFYSEFDRQKQYFTVGGKNRQHQYYYVLINGQTGAVKSIAGSPHLAQQVQQTVQEHQHPQKINKVALGYDKKRLVWEVTYRNTNHTLGYYLINFKNTKILQVINNL